MKESEARKPELRTSDVVVTRLAWLLSKLRLWVLVGTVLVICAGVYAIASAMKRN
jgi:hypothetical protein